MTMIEIPFGECRKALSIPDGFDDSNVIVTDGALGDLPSLKFVRHGPLQRIVSDCRFEVPASTRGNVSIFVGFSGAQVKLGQNCRLVANLRLWRECRIEIGEFVTINNARLVADKSEIIVGRDCMFSDEILIQSSDQHGLVDLESGEFINSGHRYIHIGEHVWVGRGSKVMPDVTVGAGAVLGTGCIVTKDVPPCSFAVGVPAQVVRTRSSWTRQPTHSNDRERDFFDRMRAQDYLEDKGQ
ncbi:MAG: acyltransferase [Pseudomonadota bacterium]